MTTQAATAERTLPDIFYEDPEPIEDGMQQEPIINLLIFALRNWFRSENVFVGGGGFVFWNRLDGNERVSPDGFVALDTNPEFVYQFPNYLMWEIGKPPDLAMEVASPSTSSNDLGRKRDLYARLGVTEYWKFDPTGGELYGTALLGERLVDGEYVSFELNVEPDGSVWSRSEVLGLDFGWDGENFDIRDPLTGESVNPSAMAERERTRADRAEEGEERERVRADHERTRADHERARADRERQARLELEAKLRRMSQERRQDEINDEETSPS